MTRLSAAVLAACLLSLGPVLAAEPTGNSLAPYGVDERLPLQIWQVVPGSPAARWIGAGDVLIEAGHVPIATLDQFSTVLRELRPASIAVRKPDGRVLQVPTALITDNLNTTLFFSPLPPGETYRTDQPNVNRIAQPAGRFVIEGGAGTVLASQWIGNGRYLELDLTLETDGTCRDCRLDTVAVMDLPTRSWLVPVPVTEVAAEAFNQETHYDQRQVVQPAPVMARLPDNLHDNGRVDYNFLGTALTGQYPGVFSAFLRGDYDFGMPALDGIYRASDDPSIGALGGERADFAASRVGTLTIGELYSSTIYQGHLFYAAPKGYDGPYLVVVDGLGPRHGVVRFEPPPQAVSIYPARALVEGPALKPVPVGTLR